MNGPNALPIYASNHSARQQRACATARRLQPPRRPAASSTTAELFASCARESSFRRRRVQDRLIAPCSRTGRILILRESREQKWAQIERGAVRRLQHDGGPTGVAVQGAWLGVRGSGCATAVYDSVLKVSAVHPRQRALSRGEIGGHDCRVCVSESALFAPRLPWLFRGKRGRELS